MRRRSRIRAAAAVVVLGSVLTLAAPLPANAADYPSWDEVEAAKADVTTREAEAERITGLLSGLQAEAGRLGDEAVRTASESAAADAALATASARADELDAAAQAASVEAEAAGARFGRVTAMLARSGPTDGALALLLASAETDAGSDPSRTLMALSRTERLADLSSGIAAEATAARADASALSAQADVAEQARARLADEARVRADAARTAHERAEAAVAEQQAALDTLYAQLASLRDRTVELERQYQIGEQARQEADARAAAEAEASGGMTPAPPPGVVVDPAGAKAYARDAVARYGWGGGEYQCLVLLWTRESSWRADAYNTSSGAYGIPQALPGSKMAVAGADWRTNAATQIDWGLAYIAGRYGAPCGAWAHSEAYNWY
ncbi:aggregation-promoting factor C-terminal-like domain-containing protein [Agromyces soli]